MILPFGRALNPYANQGRWPAREMYCPHPATNWGLNPSYSPNGVRLHSTEGFRKTAEYDSLLDWLDGKAGAKRVYVYGQSSTYCTNLLGLGQAWPDKLAAVLGGGAAVINGAVGGHSGYQSLTRLLAWGPSIKPELIVVYTCKNDITGLRVSGAGEKRVHPDWQNIANCYGWALWRAFSRRRASIDLVFTDRWGGDEDTGMARFGEDCFDAVMTRYAMVAALAAQWGGKVLFVSEVIQPSPYKALMDRINDALPGLAASHANAAWLDVRPHLLRDPGHFYDKLHLTETGCAALAELINQSIRAQNLLAGGHS